MRLRVACAGLVLWLTFVAQAAAASPSPTPAAGGDPRSSGQGPGLVGDPLLAVAGVLGIGLGAALITLGYVRLTDRRPG